MYFVGRRFYVTCFAHFRLNFGLQSPLHIFISVLLQRRIEKTRMQFIKANSLVNSTSMLENCKHLINNSPANHRAGYPPTKLFSLEKNLPIKFVVWWPIFHDIQQILISRISISILNAMVQSKTGITESGLLNSLSIYCWRSAETCVEHRYQRRNYLPVCHFDFACCNTYMTVENMQL